MSLPQIECGGILTIDDITLYNECLNVRKVFDEFVLRECLDGIEFEVAEQPENFNRTIDPLLILRNCDIINPRIVDASVNNEKRLRFIGECCCQIFAKDNNGNIVRLNVIGLPTGTNFSIGANGELCFTFNVRRTYPEADQETFNRLLHFIEQQNLNLQCLTEAIIDDENNQFNDGLLLTSMGIFIAIKLDARVQLCVPVYGYCEITDESTEDNFCDNFGAVEIPNFNPPQLNDITSQNDETP